MNDGGDLSEWNSTLITLIPKVHEPLTLKDFRPISLCNTCYKVVSRAITNRLRTVLAQVIDPYQSVFIPGRLILDNVIVGFECMHWIRNNKKAKAGFAALKLDMSKAYDTVKWIFLRAIMIKLGFVENWVNLIMRCVTSVSYAVRLNHSIVGNIYPSRGLRQGDLLSPYLFVLCAQGLSSIFTRAVELRLFKGVKIAASCPVISHIFFANDSLVFFRAKKEDGLQVRKCLLAYERASGQVVNYEKSALSFSPSTSTNDIEEIKNELSITVVQGHELYLGLPTFSLRNKRLQFAYLHERIRKKIQGWSTKFFSMGGRKILIKSVLQAIPSYAMSCFKIPISICQRIEHSCAKFWWNDTNGRRGMHWLKWENLCKPKCQGGMGFRRLSAFNKALVAKHVWRIIHSPNSLMARVLKARYLKNSDIMLAGLGNNPSFVWRSLLWGRDLINKGLYWRVGDGQHILAQSEPWIPGIPKYKSSLFVLENSIVKVADLINTAGFWNEEVVRRIFPIYEAEAILSIPLNRMGCGDLRCWMGSSNGMYNVKL